MTKVKQGSNYKGNNWETEAGTARLYLAHKPLHVTAPTIAIIAALITSKMIDDTKLQVMHAIMNKYTEKDQPYAEIVQEYLSNMGRMGLA